MILRSRFVVPVDATVIENGAIEIQDGRITAVGTARAISRRSVCTDYGDAVIVPGLVNAHTHLELSHLAGRVPPSGDFIDWLRRLMAAMSAEPPTAESVQAAVRDGLAQSVSAGVTTIGDISRSPRWTRPVLAAAPIRAVSFGEIISVGNRRGMLAERLAAASAIEHQTPRMRIGLSPHAPYTVEPEGLRACAARAADLQMRLCVHLAETRDEEAFTRSASGPFADYLRELGIWDDSIPPAECTPVQLAQATGLLHPRTLLAHVNYVSDDDIALLAGTGAHVAYCPRTHHAFAHGPHRFREMLAAGINVCVGTDSLASNPSLSILDELRFLRREYPDLGAEMLLSLGTLRGATALGFADETGSIRAGKSADLTVIPLEHSSAPLGWASIFESHKQPVAVYIAGGRQSLTGRR